MKKGFRAVMAFLTAMTLTAGSVSIPVCAADAQTSAAEKAAGTQEGTFRDGASYCFLNSSGTLVIDGKGSFTLKEYNTLVRKLSPAIVVFDKDVILPKSDKNIYKWLAYITAFSSDYTVLTVEKSDMDTKHSEMRNRLKAQAVKEKKDLENGAYSLYCMFPLEDISEHVYAPRLFFDYCDGAVEKGKKTIAYLTENGISERTAKKAAAVYLAGLQSRINNYWAYPDGSEMNEETEKNHMKILLKTAQYEDELMAQLNEDGLTYDNAVSYLTDNGKFLTTKHNYDRLVDVSRRFEAAYDLEYCGERPQDLIDAEEEAEKLYEDQFLPPDDADLDTILRYRADWMRSRFRNGYIYTEEMVDEVVGYYIEGLKIRLSEGLAQKNGMELNGDTQTEFVRLCEEFMFKSLTKQQTKDAADIEEEEKERLCVIYDKQLEMTRKLIISDYTVDTEDSAKKYVNSAGDYVEYYDITGNEGTLPDGIRYRFYPATGGIFIDGDALFSKDDVTNLEHFFDIKFYVMGKNVGYRNDLKWYISRDFVPDDEEVTLNMWLVVKALLRHRYNQFYTVPDSISVKEYYQAVDYEFENQNEPKRYNDKKEIEEKYPLNIIKDDEEMFRILNGTEKAVPDGAEASLKGDADEDGQVGLSDIIAVAKFTSNRAAYPFKSDTAKANADMNGDKMIDSRDLSMLIEAQLHYDENEERLK